MKNTKVQYVVGVSLLLLSVYQVYKEDWWEFALYASAGAGFITLATIARGVFPQHRKLLNVISWTFILIAGFLLLFLFRTDG